MKWAGRPCLRAAFETNRAISRAEASLENTLTESGIRENASNTTATLKVMIPKRPFTSVRSTIQMWFGRFARTARGTLEAASGGGGDGHRSLRIRPTVRAESFQPARASVRAIRSFPPKPASSIVLTMALTTSAKRRTGGCRAAFRAPTRKQGREGARRAGGREEPGWSNRLRRHGQDCHLAAAGKSA